jgi:membrane associated rhomboid family serine protease
MAIFRTYGSDVALGESGYDPQRLSSPRVFLLSMLVFLTITGFIAAILFRQITSAFQTNPGLNGLILGVLGVGIMLAFAQVMLAPMKALLSRSSTMALSTSSMRSMLDSIANRLDETRDITRYLIGLLVFLGLLGTFWGLLATIGSIGDTIQSLDPGSGDTNDVLEALKSGLAAPLEGMGTAFSSSLFGLAGSLVVGFLDLQAGRAQTRFYTELENWLSSVTDLSSDILTADPAKASTSEEIRVLTDRLRSMQDNTGGSNQRVATAMANLADGVSGLVKNMRTEQQLMRDWVEAQSEEQRAMRSTLEKIASALERSERERS